MSQIPGDRGLQVLIDVASGSGHRPQLRREAFFWLGQSDDPRALELIERVLGK